MKAMVLNRISDVSATETPLDFEQWPEPFADSGALILRVSACGVCHTELDEIEGRTPPPRFPVIPGHQVVGHVAAAAGAFREGDRVGVAWIFSACGECSFCLSGSENLCPQFQGTGRDANGGYAEYMTVRPEFAFPIPRPFSDSEAAPLLCAGAIGYRSLMLANLREEQALGLTGFGASAHLVLKMVRHRFPGVRVHVFARSEAERAFARELGAVWAGGTEDACPELLDSVIDTTPAWKPVVEALARLKPGGRLVINAIRKEPADIASLASLEYPKHLWMEKEIKSVANVTRRDVREFLDLAASIPLKPEFQEYRLENANRALVDLKARRIRGAKVLKMR